MLSDDAQYNRREHPQQRAALVRTQAGKSADDIGECGLLTTEQRPKDSLPGLYESCLAAAADHARQ
jgi:hypothetical protein